MAHSIGKTIAELRKEKGWTQVELAEKLQVTDKAVSKWEKDDAFPSVEFFPVLAKLFDVSIDFLMTGKVPEKEIVFMSKIELCAKNDDVSMLAGIRPDNRDENGRTLSDYVLQYESVNVYNACKNLRLSTLDNIRMALISNNIEKLDTLQIKKLAHINDKNIVPQHFRTSMAISTDDILSIIVNDPRVLDSTFDYLLAPWNDEPKYKKSSKNVWYWVIPHLIHMCYECKNYVKLSKLLAVAKETNEWASQQSRSDSCICNREINFGGYGGEDLFGIIIIEKRTIELALSIGDVEFVEKFNEINSIPLPINKQSRYVANADEIRVANLIRNNASANEIAIQSCIHEGVLCIDEVLATNNIDLIISAISNYPISTLEIQVAKMEKARMMLEQDDWRNLFEFSVDNSLEKLAKAVIAFDKNAGLAIIDAYLGSIGEITYPDGAKSNAKHVNVNSRTTRPSKDYKVNIELIESRKKQIITDVSMKHEMDKTTSELDKAYFDNELSNGNYEIVIIKLCVRLEAVLRGKYRYEGTFAEILDKYCQKVLNWSEDDGWGYMVSRSDDKTIKVLNHLRMKRNSIVHSEKTDVELTLEDIRYCVEYICKMG